MKRLNKISIVILILSTIFAVYIMIEGIGTEGKDFGPGSYYYSDVKNWEEIFYPEERVVNVK
jgi:hypothetical protein